MATIYRFLIETKTNGKDTKNGETKGKGASKKGKYTSLFGGSKGGVEANRRLRAINPLLNKATGGYWEKGMRVGRAGYGLVKGINDIGVKALLGVGATILVSFAIQTMLKIQNIQRERADKQNKQNYKALENGMNAIHGEYSIARNYWDGKINYNENR